ncbi:SET domain-containing protein [Astrocystis sublimbata]|nr:SET domain-containing protein [Astrocystis sublimbata]
MSKKIDPLRELLDWATSHGVKPNGIEPKRIPGRGVGVLATRDIQADEIILDVPTNCLRSLSTVPKARLRKLDEGSAISVHGILAAELALSTNTKYAPWDAVVPKEHDFDGMPLTWRPELQALLPTHASALLAAQEAKFQRDREAAAAAFPEELVERGKKGEGYRRYRHAWLLVNSRTFYYLDAALKKRRGATRDDHMALQPVADLFNHAAEADCHTAYGGDGFSFRATKDIKEGEEVRICYGQHGGDFLLVEYGFVMEGNCWDEVLLDDVLMKRLDEKQKERLEENGFLGRYVLDSDTVCHRTQVALRLLCCKVGEWMRFVNGSDDGEASQGVVDALLSELLREYLDVIEETVERIRTLEVGLHSQTALLVERWEQVRRLVSNRLASLENEATT